MEPSHSAPETAGTSGRSGGVEFAAAPRKLSHDAARQKQRVYWSRKSIAERLTAMTELIRQLCRMRGIDIDESETDFTPSRMCRLRGIADAVNSDGRTGA